MDRKEVSTKLKSVKSAIETINARLNDQTPFTTCNKYVPSFGLVQDLPTKRECAKLLAQIQSNFNGELGAAAQLGLDATDINADSTFMGFSLDVWTKDIQRRVDQIKDYETLAKLAKAKQTLEKHRTAEDIFNDDMDSIGDILATV